MAKEVRNRWLWLGSEDLKIELTQLEQEGRDVRPVRAKLRRLIALGDRALASARNQRRAGELLDAAQKLPMRKDYPFREPSDLAGIRRLRPRGPRRFRKRLGDKVLADRIAGAWLGRCAGCLLGKPVEGRRTDELWGFLKATRQWPLSGYIRFKVRGRAAGKYPNMARQGWFDELACMPIDDDTNYTTAGVLIVRECGRDFTPADVAQFWLGNLPLLSTCTAERVAYRNLSLQVQPPASAAWRNPYREWIGAQIRADGFGYVAAGAPELAAELAWRDACISHVRNGIYGEMLMAAVIAAAACRDDPVELLRVGLSEIPKTSRLHADLGEVIEWRRAGLTYDEAVGRIHEKWDEHSRHDWCHTNSNAAICAVALLWGEGDFGRSVCAAVQPGFDTDCNGATVGSIVGMMLGVGGIPARWTARLNDTLHTSLRGYDTVRISRIARETFELHRRMR
jgi:hypothetical protein